MSATQFIPVSQITLNVEVLRHPLPVGRIRRSPEAEGINVEILTIEIDALVSQKRVDMLRQPIPGLRVSQVKQPSVV
jgi:hypothetical protein